MKLNLDESFLVEEIYQTGANDQIMIFEGVVKPRNSYPYPAREYNGDRPNLNWPAFLAHLGKKLTLKPAFRHVA